MNQSLFLVLVEKFFALVVGRITEKFNGKKEEQTMLHKIMLTEEYSADLSWGSTELNHSVVAADVVSLDSSLPLKSRGKIGNASGKLAKIGVKFRKGEKDISDINVMRARGTDEATVVAKLFDDAPKCVRSMDVRKEIMFLQGLSTGQTLVTEEDNDGSGVRVTFGYKAENIFHAQTSPWGEGDYNPIEDIRQMFDRQARTATPSALSLSAKSTSITSAPASMARNSPQTTAGRSFCRTNSCRSPAVRQCSKPWLTSSVLPSASLTAHSALRTTTVRSLLSVRGQRQTSSACLPKLSVAWCTALSRKRPTPLLVSHIRRAAHTFSCRSTPRTTRWRNSPLHRLSVSRSSTARTASTSS